ncbi:MAG: S1 RNA-binding domain-containing protein [Patescibacteria group bacterium]|jgi:small subunit ribosomal protein S1
MNIVTNPQTEFGALLNSPDQPKYPKVGDIVEGAVIALSKSEIHLDVGGILTGVIRGNELVDESGETATLKIGDIAKATVLELENENGEMELSFRLAGHEKAWGELDELLARKEPVEVSVVAANKGGLMVKVGRIDGFLPVSQLTPEHYPRVEGGDKNKILELLNQFVGKNVTVKILDIDEAANKLIVSEKAAWEEQRTEALKGFQMNQMVEGQVTGIVDFGIFVGFGDNLEGLVHISELSWQRIDNPKEHFKVGQTIKAMIIGIEGSKISLSIKRLGDDPWANAAEKFKVGDKVKGKIARLNTFGAFIELDDIIHGLCHISELSHKRIKDPAEIVQPGETREFKIISFDPIQHRLGLSLKALEPEPEKEPEAKEKPDETVTEEKPAEKPETPVEAEDK